MMGERGTKREEKRGREDTTTCDVLFSYLFDGHLLSGLFVCSLTHH